MTELNRAALEALTKAQQALDEAVQLAQIAAITMTPSNIRPEKLNDWRAEQVNPTKNASIKAATQKRDERLESLGWTLTEWLQRYKAAQKGR
ncbi:MAG TPA: hypothetical protein VD907_01370 [Verrucomicrobiae bacterium]|nr:hypothetical protein [Verrucomicrobiae bacterium]